jgi:hypothetical protein
VGQDALLLKNGVKCLIFHDVEFTYIYWLVRTPSLRPVMDLSQEKMIISSLLLRANRGYGGGVIISPEVEFIDVCFV